MDRAPDRRCPWCLGDVQYERYHDAEWGVPCHDERRLFEMLILEGQQAGLSWITVLRKRAHYRRVWKSFDPVAIVRMRPSTIERIAADPGVIRHRGKVEAVVKNARALLALHEAGESLADLAWAEVDGTVCHTSAARLEDVPSSTAASTRLARRLKAGGFVFVGETTCYAFMQAAGLVNDHLVPCPRHAEIRALARRTV